MSPNFIWALFVAYNASTVKDQRFALFKRNQMFRVLYSEWNILVKWVKNNDFTWLMLILQTTRRVDVENSLCKNKVEYDFGLCLVWQPKQDEYDSGLGLVTSRYQTQPREK